MARASPPVYADRTGFCQNGETTATGYAQASHSGRSPSAGCSGTAAIPFHTAFQVDGTTFSDVIVFQAVHPLEGKPQRRTLKLAAGRATGRFEVTAFDPPTHTYDVRMETKASADMSVWMRTWYGQRLGVFDSLAGNSSCRFRQGRADCLFPFPALEAQRAGPWTLIAHKRSGPPIRVRIEVTFNPL